MTSTYTTNHPEQQADPARTQAVGGAVVPVAAGLAGLITAMSAVAVTALLSHGATTTAWIVVAFGAVALASIAAAVVQARRSLPAPIARPAAGVPETTVPDAVLDAATAAAARERMQDAIRAERQMLATVVNNLQHAVVGIDASMRLVLCNDRYLDLYGLPREAAEPGLPLEALLRRKARAGTAPGDAEAFIRWVAARKTATAEVELADGRVIRITNRPLAVGGWVSTHEDVTEQRRAETALLLRAELLAGVLDGLPDAILVKDARDLRYVLANRAAEALLGLPRSAIVGKTARQIFPDATAALIAADDRDVITTREPTLVTERAIETPAAGPRIVSARCVPVRDRTGELQFLLTAIEDRSGRVRPLTRPLRLAS
ncbi:PAS-domain containing protein [Rhodoplanes sp. TEM]|uniref:PAS-domain containing protein n=1 Tax=Rhodoplanes tepidamans TaxID=200616 RepID=A0ABT5J3Q7_RHOTP|nr:MULTISPECIES: PAS-domain containing protein [Rhodoplanes]MDC7784288.1 PAS-domain containing protein [Rhodoplanes tepidamans]MDC7983680.1 PAS-domain containing protein [Rhodoplanes sp. TEM]MDQ0353690.1 PAS domain S-box-containing protein [Rhodoplanes tepidamans]